MQISIHSGEPERTGKLTLGSDVKPSTFILKYSGTSKMVFDYFLNQPLQDKWLEFWHNAKHSHAQQHHCYSHIEAAKGRKPIYVAGMKKNNIVIAGIFSIRPLFFNNKYSLEAVCLRGPVFDDKNALAEFLPHIVQQFRALGVGRVRVSPYWTYPEAVEIEMFLKDNGFAPYYPKEGSKFRSGYIDLTKTPEEMYKTMSKSAQEAIKRINSLGIEFRDVTEEKDTNDTYKSFNRMRARGGMTKMSAKEFKAIFEWILKNKDLGILTNAYKEGHFLGTLWSMRGPQVAHLMGYSVEHEITNKLVKRYTLGYMLWWKHLLWAKTNGASFYNVEGYEDDTPNWDPQKRISEFKEKLGTKEVDVLSEHTLVCTKMIDRVYRTLRFGNKCKRFLLSLPYQWHKRTVKDFSRNARQTAH